MWFIYYQDSRMIDRSTRLISFNNSMRRDGSSLTNHLPAVSCLIIQLVTIHPLETSMAIYFPKLSVQNRLASPTNARSPKLPRSSRTLSVNSREDRHECRWWVSVPCSCWRYPITRNWWHNNVTFSTTALMIIWVFISKSVFRKSGLALIFW